MAVRHDPAPARGRQRAGRPPRPLPGPGARAALGPRASRGSWPTARPRRCSWTARRRARAWCASPWTTSSTHPGRPRPRPAGVCSRPAAFVASRVCFGCWMFKAVVHRLITIVSLPHLFHVRPFLLSQRKCCCQVAHLCGVRQFRQFRWMTTFINTLLSTHGVSFARFFSLVTR